MATFLIIATLVNFLWCVANSQKLKKEHAAVEAMCLVIDERFNEIDGCNTDLHETNETLQETQERHAKAIQHCLKHLDETR